MVGGGHHARDMVARIDDNRLPAIGLRRFGGGDSGRAAANNHHAFGINGAGEIRESLGLDGNRGGKADEHGCLHGCSYRTSVLTILRCDK